jgi:uncharacterized protein YlxW (UPF0749 family)
MTDRSDDDPRPTGPAGDLPRPAASAASDAAGLPDEETRRLGRPVADETRPLTRPVEDETRPLTRPVTDETRALSRPVEDETRALRPPPVPGTVKPDDEPPLGDERTPSDDEPTLKQETLGAGGQEPGGENSGAREAVDGGEARRPADRAEGTPEPEAGVRGVDDAGASGGGDARVPEKPAPAKKKVTSAGALIWVLLLLLGYTLVVQLRSNNDDQGLATARQEDLVSILSDLESRDSRLQTEIQSLESSQRQLTSGVSSRQAALAEAEKRADELGLLAGTLPGKGPGLKITIDKVKASAILNAVQELRGSGGEVMELAGASGAAVRIVASSFFVDAEGGGIDVDGTRLTGPWTLWVIGSPQTMQTALQIPGGVVASINGAGGSVTMEAQTMVEVTAVRKAGSLQYAKPAS